MRKKVQLFVSYNQEHRIIKNELLESIQTGRALASKAFEGMLGDDTGENISRENPKYCELSAQYWVWKHYEEIGNPEYVGFMHYRRHFVFNPSLNITDTERWLPGIPVFWMDGISDPEVQENLQEQYIIQTLQTKADCYVIQPYDIRFFNNNNRYLKEHYLNTIPGAKRRVWDVFQEVLSDLYPQDQQLWDDFAYGHTMYLCNMFIMKKELFFEYNKFLFNVLQEVDRRVDSSCFTSQEMRFLGYLGEYLLSLFVMKLQQRGAKLQYLQAVLIRYPDGKPVRSSRLSRFLKKLFSVTKDNQYRTMRICGIKIKMHRCTRTHQILQQLVWQEKLLQTLENKVTNLEEELFLARKNQATYEKKLIAEQKKHDTDHH